MKKRKNFKKCIGWILCAVMLLTLIVPQNISAAQNNNLYRYCEVKTGKFGCVNRKGKVIVKPTYDQYQGKRSDQSSI